jgi:PHD/YefM family antitoxin component YafN of YafNO toxin-antitoxin module
MRNILDAAIKGEVSVIERYNRPEAVVIGYEQWEQMEALRSRCEAQKSSRPAEPTK